MPTPCSVPGCNLYASVKGMCRGHYGRSIRIAHGDTKVPLDAPLRPYHPKPKKPVGPNDLMDKYKSKTDCFNKPVSGQVTGTQFKGLESAYDTPLPPAQAAQRQEAVDDAKYKAMGMSELLAQLDIARNAIVHITRELRRRLG